MSIIKRQILLLILFVAVFWIAAATISRSVFTSELDETIESHLSKTAIRLMPLVVHVIVGDKDMDDRSEPQELDDEVRFLVFNQGGYLAYEVRNDKGVVLLRSFDAKDFQFPASTHLGYSKNNDLLSYTVIDQQTGLSLTVTEPESHREEAILEATTALYLPLLILIPLMIAAVLWLTKHTLAPIGELRRQISTRGGSNFDPLDTTDQPVELRPITRSVDRLLERLKIAMNAEKQFAANSAHELRTPLAGAIVQTQRLKTELADGPGYQHAVQLEATLQRLAKFTEKLLQLSRLDSGSVIEAKRENLTPALNLVIEEFTKNNQNSKRIVVVNNLQQDLIVAMDIDHFAIAIRNLVENALVHGKTEQPVYLVIEENWSIHIINRGDVIPFKMLKDLSERFARGQTVTEGSGLGLSIVNTIMTNCGGSLMLFSPAIDLKDGFEAVLQLP